MITFNSQCYPWPESHAPIDCKTLEIVKLQCDYWLSNHY